MAAIRHWPRRLSVWLKAGDRDWASAQMYIPWIHVIVKKTSDVTSIR